MRPLNYELFSIARSILILKRLKHEKMWRLDGMDIEMIPIVIIAIAVC